MSNNININLDSKKKITKILVAIDGSDHSFKAANYSLDLARSFGAQVFAVTVTYIPANENISQKQILGKALVEDRVDATHDSELWFDKFIGQARDDKINLKTELLNSTRPVDYVILEYAEENNIDLIILGTKGRTGFKKLLLGSVASSVVSYAHCPVLVVK